MPTQKQIIDAYCRIRQIDHNIPDDVLDFMKEAAIEALYGEPSLTTDDDIKLQEEAEKAYPCDAAIGSYYRSVAESERSAYISGRRVSLSILKEKEKEIEALKTALTWLAESVPSQTDDADWWPDELSEAMKNAKLILTPQIK